MERTLSLVATVFASLSLFSTGCAQSQHTDRTESGNLYLIVQNGKFGFIDSKGRVVIKPQFLKANSFSEGLTAVAIGNSSQDYKVAFIGTTGRFVIETDDSPGEVGFSSGLAVLLKNSSSSSYYIDKSGKRLYPAARAELKKAHSWYYERSPLSATAFAHVIDMLSPESSKPRRSIPCRARNTQTRSSTLPVQHIVSTCGVVVSDCCGDTPETASRLLVRSGPAR